MPKTDLTLIRVGHSPDPDDAFMFYALAKRKIPMRGFRVEHVIEEIESLNQRALKGELEVTAISCHAYAYVADRYAVMTSGASVGDDYGPVLVARPEIARELIRPGVSLKGRCVAVPGELTTGYLVLQLFEKNFRPVFVPFDQIFDVVKTGKADLGLIIHEGQITYQKHGFEKIVDLGQWWMKKTHLCLPLGIDVIRKDLGADTIREFSLLFKESIQYALDHRDDALEYALEYGRGLPKNLGDRFVGMYVNDYTVDLGKAGRNGFSRLMEEGYAAGIFPQRIQPEFV